jgi:hypothetical protein
MAETYDEPPCRKTLIAAEVGIRQVRNGLSDLGVGLSLAERGARQGESIFECS